MPNMDRDTVSVSCPACGKDINTEYRHIWSGSRKIACRCRTEIRFDMSLANQARREADDVDKAYRDFEKAFQKLINEKLEVSKR